LLFDRFVVMISKAMTFSPVRKIFAVLLAVLVTAGLSLSVAQASDMAFKMSMAAEMATSGHGGCHACDSGDAGKAKAASCATVCAPFLATLPQTAPLAVAETATIARIPKDELPRGTKPPSKRTPPRTLTLG
jgi:hypothetical protein